MPISSNSAMNSNSTISPKTVSLKDPPIFGTDTTVSGLATYKRKLSAHLTSIGCDIFSLLDGALLPSYPVQSKKSDGATTHARVGEFITRLRRRYKIKGMYDLETASAKAYA